MRNLLNLKDKLFRQNYLSHHHQYFYPFQVHCFEQHPIYYTNYIKSDRKIRNNVDLLHLLSEDFQDFDFLYYPL